MIKLQDILTINDIKYSDKIKPKHQKKMNMETTILDDVKVPDNPFPENSSKETRDELQWLMDYNNGVLDKKYSKDGDDVLKVFEDYCKENDLEFNKSYYDKLLKEIAKEKRQSVKTNRRNAAQKKYVQDLSDARAKYRQMFLDNNLKPSDYGL